MVSSAPYSYNVSTDYTICVYLALWPWVAGNESLKRRLALRAIGSVHPMRCLRGNSAQIADAYDFESGIIAEPLRAPRRQVLGGT